MLISPPFLSDQASTDADDEAIRHSFTGSYSQFNASGIEEGSNGTWTANAASHSMPEGKSVPVVMPVMPVVPEKSDYGIRLDTSALLYTPGLPASMELARHIQAYADIQKIADMRANAVSAWLFTKTEQTEKIYAEIGTEGWRIEETISQTGRA